MGILRLRPALDNWTRQLGGAGAALSWVIETLAWQTAVIANGGTVSAGTLTAVQDFLEDLAIAGLRSKILRLNLFAGDQLAAALVPQIKDAGSSTDANTRFVGGDFVEATGLNPGSPNTNTATAKYLNTGLTLSGNVSLTSCSYGFWAANNPQSTTNGAMMGAWETDFIIARLSGYTSGYRMADSFGSGNSRVQYGPGQTNKTGLLSASRVSATDHRLYEDGAEVAINTSTAIIAAPNGAMNVFRRPASNVFEDEYCSQAAYGYFVGLAINNDEMANLHNAWATFNAALGRS